MEPVALILGALAGGTASGVGQTATKAVQDAYEALKSAILRRFGDRPRGVQALEDHAEDAETYEKPLAKQLRESGADTDPQIIAAAKELLRLLDEQGVRGPKYSVDLRGAMGVQVGDGNTQSNTFGR